jgi:hypothetical protein
MFVVSEAEAAAIRAAFEPRGEFAAAVERGVCSRASPNNRHARECAPAITAWKPAPLSEPMETPKNHTAP